MNMFSLGTIIDDILLLVRNNNISESEDLSRALIAAWILAYRAAMIKAKRDSEDDGNDEDTSLEEFIETRGPLELVDEESLDDTPLFRRKLKEPITDLLDDDSRNIISVHDQEGFPIQYMSEHRKFFHRYRKYTGGELTYDYINGYITIQGTVDLGLLKYIWVEGLFTGDSDDDNIEDVKIPGWMIPDIKKNIMLNELAFMLQRISDDDNNSTLDGIKPQAQAVNPNEK